jgi:hypothetical protein
MFKQLYSLLILLSLAFSTYAQEGDFFMVNHVPPSGAIDHTNFSITQDEDGFMWIANRKGVVQNDGRNWDLYPTPSAIFKVLSTPEGIYASGRNLIGKVSRSISKVDFSPITSSDSLDDVFSGAIYKQYVVFMSEHLLTIIDRESDQVVKSFRRDDLEFNDLFSYEDALLVSTENKGNFLLSLSGNQWLFEPIDTFDDYGILISVSGNSNGKYLAINEEGYILELNAAMDTLKFEESGYLINSIPTSIQWVGNSLVAISTLSGGVIFINTVTLDYEITDYYSGLPENQIYAINVDKDYGVWVAHAYGLTRIMPALPIRSFSHIPGIEGNILTVRNYMGQIYAGSTVGVFVLKKIPVFTERTVYDRITTTTAAEEPIVEEKVKSKKGLFSFLKKKKTPSVTTTSTEPGTTSHTRYVKRIERELHSLSYSFQPIASIGEETSQFIPLDDGLLAGGLSGIYELRDTVAIPISNEPIRYLHYSETNRMITASTFDNEMITFLRRGTGWVRTGTLDGLEDFIYHITESGEDMWLAGADSIYRLDFQGGALDDVDVYPLENPHFDETYSINDGGKMIFLNRSGFLSRDVSTNHIVKDSTLTNKYGVPQKIFVSNNKSIWVNNGKNWQTIGADQPVDNYNFLYAFPSIRQLEYAPHDSSYWVVTFDNDIFNIQPKNGVVSSTFQVHLKEASNNNAPLDPNEIFDIQQEGNNLDFTFIKPEYSGLMEIQYRYKLEGLSRIWSSWSKDNNRINFSYLPPGKYTLRVETKNNFDVPDSYAPIRFNVVPPYWRQLWFYALEVVLFTFLLILSIRLNRGSTKYGILSRLLAFLTLILIVEFVQTMAEYSFETDNSPVIDFFIQVSIALLVLPVESLLRKAIFKAEVQTENTKS